MTTRIRPLATWCIAASAALLSATSGAASLYEGFNTVVPAGWTAINNSDNAAQAQLDTGQAGWFQGITGSTTFSALGTPSNSYAAASFNSTIDAGTISAWLITPTLSFDNGNVLTFYTRTTTKSQFADGLEVRFSDVGGTDVGSTPTGVGTFTTLLTAINSGLAVGDYPEAWTLYTVTFAGLSGPTDGAIAFRYFVTDGGPLGTNSNYIGLDTVTIAVPEPASSLAFAAGVLALAALRRRPRQG
jgi:hypothetical protein